MSYMGTFKSRKQCKRRLKICLKCSYIMHSFMSPLYVGVCKNIRFWQKFYKDYIGPCMKRLGSTPIIPACKHSGIKNIE